MTGYCLAFYFVYAFQGNGVMEIIEGINYRPKVIVNKYGVYGDFYLRPEPQDCRCEAIK